MWGGVVTHDLRPFCVSPSKLYGCFGDPRPHVARPIRWLARYDGLAWEVQQITGCDLVRVYERRPAPARPPVETAVRDLRRHVDERLDRLESQLREQSSPRPGRGLRLRRRAARERPVG